MGAQLRILCKAKRKADAPHDVIIVEASIEQMPQSLPRERGEGGRLSSQH
jgi:protein-L-isoaspartate O-methyltransferase